MGNPRNPLTTMDSLTQSLCTYCRLVYDRRLTSGTGGNVSIRFKDRILCTPSGFSLRTIPPHSISVLNGKGQLIDGATATKELGMHMAILMERLDINVVFHLHGAHIIAASTLLQPGTDTLPALTPEFVYHAYPLRMLPFMVPGSQELREAARERFSRNDTHALLLQNHGLITVGKDLESALNIAEAVDEAARIFIFTRGKASVIPKERIADIKTI
ncbi:MAG: class II aldolase/adducin family protein [Deltaproteobacteria bacterium]|nr:class II aldolase/adducin family protein [Deltaproteobacteria bacterium]